LKGTLKAATKESVLWSPSLDVLVVNDYEGCDASHSALFAAPWTNQPVDLREKLIEFLRLRGDGSFAMRFSAE
jgi:hypothetical protein